MKALACELPVKLGLPLSRFSRSELRRYVLAAGIVAEISGVTNLALAERGRAASVESPELDLPPRPIRVEHEYRRHGVCAYLAAWGVHRARLFGHVLNKISIAAFDAFVAHVMAQKPYRSARRVFWIVDGSTIHRGQAAADRLEGRFPNLTLVHLPRHASWLNQIEIYFSILQRKALTPADFPSLDAVAARILGFQDHYQQFARPFEWEVHKSRPATPHRPMCHIPAGDPGRRMRIRHRTSEPVS